jgi:hypothetical protein
MALENILRSSIVPYFPTSQPDTREEYYLPPSYVVPCQTSEPLHCQRGGQSTFVTLDISYPQIPFVGGLNDDACHPPCLTLPFPRSLPSPPLPFPDTSRYLRKIQRTTIVLSKKKFDIYSVQPQYGSIREQDERLAQSGPSEPSGNYANKIADRHFLPFDPAKIRKRAVRHHIKRHLRGELLINI